MSSNRVEEEYETITTNKSWTLVYQKLGQRCQPFIRTYTFNEARKLENKPLNRYRDVNPYDHSRVVIQRANKNYINANLVKMERANRRYILTQGPLGFTVGHFWAMAWEQNTKAIIMLNKVIEKNELKCHWYWPHGVGDGHKLVLGDVDLIIEQTTEEDFNFYTTRLFKVTDTVTKEVREITQFHYTTWPDFDVPSSPAAFLQFLKRIRDSGALESNVGPAIVHCSAGIGRSGTFCLIDTSLLLIEKEGQANVDVQEILVEMRKYRMGLIQTCDQLRFSYQTIIEGIKQMDPNYDTANSNENIYSVAADLEETPPPPPPRGESLGRPPQRPLPAIPTSSSFDTLNVVVRNEEAASSSSEECPPTPPSRGTTLPRSSPPLSSPPASPGSLDDFYDSYSNDEDELPPEYEESIERDAASLRKRRNQEMSERIALMKKRSMEADRWHSSRKRLKSEDNVRTYED